jgi:S-adenosylhomocysteine hydrolase
MKLMKPQWFSPRFNGIPSRSSSVVSLSGFKHLRFFATTNEGEIPPTLPVLEEYINKQVQEGKGTPLKGTTVLLIQHQIPQHVAMVKGLHKLGLEPKQTFCLDIPFSSTTKVAEKLRQEGIPSAQIFQHQYKLSMSYQHYQQQRVKKVANQLKEKLKSGDRLIVLDEGSNFMEVLSSMESKILCKVAIVEHTPNGLIKMREKKKLQLLSNNVPIINVADSRPKRDLESSYLTEHLVEQLRKVKGFEVKPGQKCLITGYGALGKAAAHVAKSMLGFPASNIWVIDYNDAPMREAVADGYNKFDRKTTKEEFNLVLGTSGNMLITVRDHQWYANGILFASCSTVSNEFPVEDFVTLSSTTKHMNPDFTGFKMLNPEVFQSKDIHQTVQFQFQTGKTLTFINGGFPLQNPGTLTSCVPTEKMQFTCLTSVAAAVQAANSFEQKGLQAMEEDTQNWIVDRYKALMSSSGSQASI